MSNKAKKIFLLLSVVVPFLLYCVYYYGMMVKNAPYKFSEFKSLEFQYGNADSLLNKYDSKTGEYQYLNMQDSLIKTKLFLTKNDLLYIHRKAADLGFWNFPANETAKADTGKKPMRFIMALNYQRKTKKVTYDATYDGAAELKDANERLIKEIQKILTLAEERQKK
jgi:hypothetical protein